MADSKTIAYTAGIIDADGCIYINRQLQKHGVNPCYVLCVGVTNTKRKLLEWLQEHWGGSIVKGSPPQRENHSQSWAWRLQCDRATELLRLALPYLNAKPLQAKFGIQFSDYKMRRRAGAYYLVVPRAELQFREMHKVLIGLANGEKSRCQLALS